MFEANFRLHLRAIDKFFEMVMNNLARVLMTVPMIYDGENAKLALHLDFIIIRLNDFGNYL